jgi:hypothetical protein
MILVSNEAKMFFFSFFFLKNGHKLNTSIQESETFFYASKSLAIGEEPEREVEKTVLAIADERPETTLIYSLASSTSPFIISLNVGNTYLFFLSQRIPRKLY